MIQRFSVSLESGLLAQFDEDISLRSYTNRSEAIRDLIRNALLQKEWEGDGNVIGVVSLIYDHSQPSLQNRITQTQHDSHDQIISTTHVHIDHDNCLEVIIVSGTAHEVTRLSDSLAALRGVRNCNLSITGIGEHESHGDHDHHTHQSAGHRHEATPHTSDEVDAQQTGPEEN